MVDVSNVEFQVKQRDLPVHRTVEVEVQPLAPGEIRVAIDRFAFTANNLTYGAAGDLLGYWRFFPAAENSSGEWGILPVWGYGDVVESTVDNVPVGDRLYGYFPPASSVVMTPTDVRRSSLTDGATHRQKLPPLYNGYRRVLADAEYDRAEDDATILLGPLHLTSFVLAHKLSTNAFYDADQVVIVSASSKTSLGLAYALGSDDGAPTVIGATSDRNADFVSSVGLYEHTVTYDTIDALPDLTTVVVDMAGNPMVASSIAERLGAGVKRYINVGLTHWEEQGATDTFSGRPQPASVESFFAPGYIYEHMRNWGGEGFDSESSTFLRRAAEATFGWMNVAHYRGVEGLSSVYGEVCSGSLAPSVGVVVEMPISR